MSAHFEMSSSSLAQDMGYLALADIAELHAREPFDHRLVGGLAVSLLVAVFETNDVPDRDTADADVATEFEILRSDSLIDGLRSLNYTLDDGSSLSRPLTETEVATYEEVGDTELRPTIDLMAPSFSGEHEPNQQAGEFAVDAFPGLILVLAKDPIEVTVKVRLTVSETREIPLLLPAPDSLLVVKLLAWKDRHARKDVVDIWRLLAVCREAGIETNSWRPFGARKDALEQLSLLTNPNGVALRMAGIEGREALAFRALAQRTVSAPPS